MRSSEQIDQLATALAKAQGIMANAVINKVNPHFKAKYADLAAIREAVSGPLAQNGIAVMQVINSDEHGAFLSTRLCHASGQWIESIYPLPNNVKPQEFGSALTYARRYSLAAICGISAEEDDDANNASEPMQTVRAPSPTPPRVAAPAPKDATSTAAEWAKNQTTVIRTMSSLQALVDWEKNNDSILKRLTAKDPKAADNLFDVIRDVRAKFTNFGMAAE